MTGLEFVASILNSIAWPTAVVITVVALRRELAGTFRRMQSLKFPGGEATFAMLENYEPMIAAARGDEKPGDLPVVRYEEAQFSALESLAAAAPGKAIIDAWGLLEYQLNVASDRLAPDQPHGWPQVAYNLESWDKWQMLYPVVLELRQLRDYTVHTRRPPSPSDAARYVSVAQDLVITLRTSLISQSGDSAGGAA
ncbi:MAG TPA: hypothetical protein VMG38_14715 [Trebonia sp.]|nr:hypothetical protein [Trebonia sp.]